MEEKILINLNESVIKDCFNTKQTKALYAYAILKYLSRNLGYISREDFIVGAKELAGVSERTCYRWIPLLRAANLARYRKGVFYPKGQKKLQKLFSFTNMYTQFTADELSSYATFRNFAIRQHALLIQKRMSSGIRRNRRFIDSDSLVSSGKVETRLAIVKDHKKAGCSLSKISEDLGIDITTASRALKGFTEKQFGKSYPIKGAIVRKKYDFLFSKSSRGPMWSYKYLPATDEYILKYALASRLHVPSSLKRLKSKTQENFSSPYQGSLSVDTPWTQTGATLLDLLNSTTPSPSEGLFNRIMLGDPSRGPIVGLNNTTSNNQVSVMEPPIY